MFESKSGDIYLHNILSKHWTVAMITYMTVDITIAIISTSTITITNSNTGIMITSILQLQLWLLMSSI